MTTTINNQPWLNVPPRIRTHLLREFQKFNIKYHKQGKKALITKQHLQKLQQCNPSKRVKELLACCISAYDTGIFVDTKLHSHDRGDNSLMSISKRLGLHKNHLSVLKTTSPKKFEHMMSFDPSPYKSVLQYIDHVETLRQEIQDIIVSSKEGQDFVVQYYTKIKTNNKEYHMVSAMDKVVFSLVDPFSVQYPTVTKWEKILKDYKQFHQTNAA